MADTVLVHPNRDKPEAKATRAVVMLLLITSAALILIVTIGGWTELQGMQIVSFLYVFLYVLMAYFVGKWNRGVLPVAAGLAILFAVVAAVAGPASTTRRSSPRSSGCSPSSSCRCSCSWSPSRCAASSSSGPPRSRSRATR